MSDKCNCPNCDGSCKQPNTDTVCPKCGVKRRKSQPRCWFCDMRAERSYTYPEFIEKYFPNDDPKRIFGSETETQAGFREAWSEMLAGDIHPIETLWDGIDDE